jgi:hypothetical protein
MSLIWVLVVLPTICLLYIASVIVRGNKPISTIYVTPLPRLPFGVRTTIGVPYGIHRTIKLVSARELDEIMKGPADAIFIDVKAAGSGTPDSLLGIHALSVEPVELFEVLKWIPPETSIVLRGASDLSKAIIWSGHNIVGLAPVYIITGDLFQLEAA